MKKEDVYMQTVKSRNHNSDREDTCCEQESKQIEEKKA